LNSLTRFEIDENQIHLIPEWIGALPDLRQLAVGENDFTHLPDWLGRLTSLTRLDINDCHLTSVPQWLENLRRLKELFLDGNSLTQIPEWMGDLEELTTLRLDNNHLRTLPESLAKLKKLTRLEIDRNPLAEIPEWIRHLDGLTKLDLSGNNFSVLPVWLGDLTDLQRLYLSSCNLHTVPDWLTALHRITHLDLGENLLTELPARLKLNGRLINLGLGGNKLTEAPTVLQSLRRLEYINLSANKLRESPSWIAQLPALRELYLNNNQIVTFEAPSRDFSPLTALHLANNKFDRIPEWISTCTDLKLLSIDGNRLDGVPDWIAHLSHLEWLDTSNCGLTEAPPWLHTLTNLTRLDLSFNRISFIPSTIGELSGLQQLYLEGNTLTDLPQSLSKASHLTTLYIYGNNFKFIPGCVQELTELQSLICNNNELGELPEWLGDLTSLAWLDVTGNKISALPNSMAKLTRLNRLALSLNTISTLPDWIGTFNRLTHFYATATGLKEIPPDIAQLANLEHLILGYNEISNLPSDLGDLSSLEELDLSGNLLTEIPDWLLNLPRLESLLVSDNPRLVSPPPEIIASGTSSVLAFCRARREGASRQWLSKLLVVGEGGVGKTSAIKALLGDKHDPKEVSTHGIRISDLLIQNPEQADVQMKLSTWDFGGQEIYHATHQFFLTDRSLFLLLWNARLGWEQGKLEYWLDIIKSRAPQSPVLLVATNADASQRPVDLPLADLRREYPQVSGNLIIDNETRRGIEQLRAEIAQRAADLPLMGAEWPTTWLNAAQEVKAFPAKHITPEHMWQLMADVGVTDEEQRRYIAVAMHELGDILYYRDDPELGQTVVLRPDWVNAYISEVLDSEAVDQAHGLLTQAEMARLWASLDRGMRDHFLGMMDKYEISFRVDGTATGVVSLVVERLPWNPPAFEDDWERLAAVPGTSEIRVRYQLNTTPPGIPTWFIARSHRFTTNTHWRTGALLAHPDSLHRALVRAQPRRNSVELTVRGPAPAAFFSILDDGFNQTLLRYPGLEIKRLVPCPCGKAEGTECSELFDYDDLQKRLLRTPPRHEIECHRSGEMMNIPALLLGIAPSERDSARVAIERLTAMVDGYGTMLDTKVDGLTAGLAESTGKLDDIAGGMALQGEELTGIAGGIASQAEYLQRMFLKLLRLTQDTQEVHCPSVFSVVPVKTGVLGAKYEIRLYCEEPGAWHPLPGDAGRYPVSESADWLRKIRPHLRLLLTVLKHASPLAGPVLGMAVGQVSDRVSAELDAMTEIVDQIPEFSRDSDLPAKDGRSDPDPSERATNEADFRALESLLVKLDPDRGWGGLSRTVTPEGPILYLCRDHAAAYRRAARL
jgi:internalin A